MFWRKITVLVLFALLLGAAPASQSDRAKEKRWEAQIRDTLLVGEAVELKTANADFLALYAEPTNDESKGGVILIHGIGVHPAWPDVIQPLRINLPEHGWHTLSLQMPVLANDVDAAAYPPLFDDADQRIAAGIAYLKQHGVDNIVIVAHSLGSAMASSYLASHPNAGAKAFVGIGMGYNDADPRLDNAQALAKIHLPVLDLYGAQDLAQVRNHAAERAAAAKKAGNKAYRQEQIEGADHFFRGMEPTLNRTVRGWLEQATGVRQ